MMARMLHASASVVSVHDDGIADVRIDEPAACSSCGAQAACRGGPARLVRVAVPAGMRTGDRVWLQLPETDLNRGALLAYLLPALTTLLGSVLLAAGGDALATLGAALGLACGLLCLRISIRHGSGFDVRACQPHSSQGASQ